MAAVALLVCTAGVSAQDLGAPDSVIVAFTHMPNMDTDDSLVVFTVTFAIHDDVIRSASTGMGWDFAGLELDSAVWSAEGLLAWPTFKYEWANSNRDSTNSRQLFQVTGFGFGTSDMTTTTQMITYYGHVNTWVYGDTITIAPDPFVAMGFVDNTNFEFVPVWGGDKVIADVTNIGGGLLPVKFDLAQNYPNPFNPRTTVRFDLPKKAHTTLTVFNVLGQTVTTLVDTELPAGYYDVEWDGTSDHGGQVASGIYFYRLDAGNNVMTKKMMLLK
jgi:hypothetical protein